MQAFRIITWVVLSAVVILFAAVNWTPVAVMIWDGILLETKVPALMLFSFLLGFMPMWLLHHGTNWRFRRKIRSLENAAQSATSTLAPSNPVHEPTDNKPEPV